MLGIFFIISDSTVDGNLWDRRLCKYSRCSVLEHKTPFTRHKWSFVVESARQEARQIRQGQSGDVAFFAAENSESLIAAALSLEESSTQIKK